MPPWTSQSLSHDFKVDKRSVLLASQNVPIAGAAVWRFAIDGELDCIADIEGDEVRDPVRGDVEQARNGLPREGAAPNNALVGLPVGKDDVECHLVDAGVLTAQ